MRRSSCSRTVKAVGSARPARLPKKRSLPASKAFCRPCRNSRRNRRERTRTGRKKPGRQAIQRVPSSEGPPPGTTQWMCGWCCRVCPQVWRTAVTPTWAPRCLGSRKSRQATFPQCSPLDFNDQGRLSTPLKGQNVSLIRVGRGTPSSRPPASYRSDDGSSFAGYPEDRASRLAGNLREGTVVDILAAPQEPD